MATATSEVKQVPIIEMRDEVVITLVMPRGEAWSLRGAVRAALEGGTYRCTRLGVDRLQSVVDALNPLVGD